MSHTSKHKAKITDLREMAKVAKSKGYIVREGDLFIDFYGPTKIFASLGIQLKDWKYEVAITKEGDLMYDAFGTLPQAVKQLRDLIVDYNEKVIIKNVPMDKITGLIVNKVGTKKEITLAYR